MGGNPRAGSSPASASWYQRTYVDARAAARYPSRVGLEQIWNSRGFVWHSCRWSAHSRRHSILLNRATVRSAGLHRNPHSGVYSVRFRYDGRNVIRSLRTSNERQAKDLVARIEETIQLIQRGRIDVPPHARAVEFIMSGGLRTSPRRRLLRPQLQSAYGLLPLGPGESKLIQHGDGLAY